MPGFFITFEGGEGSGKTTQINKLAESLNAAGYKVVTTREPGGTPESEKIRQLLVQRDGGNWSPMAEALMFFAARLMLYQKIIKPALDEGKIVICDRFTDSTRAYQGYGHDLGFDVIDELKHIALGDAEPNLTFILDIDPKSGIERAQERLSSQKINAERREDRFEKLDLSFHQRLREGFLQIAKREPQRCVIVDAAQTIEHMAQSILQTALKRLEERLEERKG